MGQAKAKAKAKALRALNPVVISKSEHHTLTQSDRYILDIDSDVLNDDRLAELEDCIDELGVLVGTKCRVIVDGKECERVIFDSTLPVETVISTINDLTIGFNLPPSFMLNSQGRIIWTFDHPQNRVMGMNETFIDEFCLRVETDAPTTPEAARVMTHASDFGSPGSMYLIVFRKSIADYGIAGLKAINEYLCNVIEETAWMKAYWTLVHNDTHPKVMLPTTVESVKRVTEAMQLHEWPIEHDTIKQYIQDGPELDTLTEQELLILRLKDIDVTFRK